MSNELEAPRLLNSVLEGPAFSVAVLVGPSLALIALVVIVNSYNSSTQLLNPLPIALTPTFKLLELEVGPRPVSELVKRTTQILYSALVQPHQLSLTNQTQLNIQVQSDSS
jgi:hypothetical protein